MHTIWSGNITFGLVTIPIRLFSGASSHRIGFDLLRENDQCPIKYVKVCEKDGKEVPWQNIVKGYEIEDNYYVTLKEEDFENAAAEESNNMEILDFVNLSEIHPRYFQKPYLIKPEKGAEKSYNLLRKSILKSKFVGITKFVIRNKEHLGALIADEQILYLIQMRFHHDLRDPEKLSLPDQEKPAKKETDMAMKLIEQMKTEFKPQKYKDTYQDKLKKSIEKKAKNEKIKPAGKGKKKSVTSNLMKQLKESLEKTN